MNFDAIVFDLDGTLIDSTQDLCRGVNYVRSELAISPLKHQLIQNHIGYGIHHLISRCMPENASETEIDIAVEKMQTWYREHGLDNTTYFEGIPAVLDVLHGAGVKLAVVSNKVHAFTCQIVETLGGPFEFVLGDHPALPRKPAPDMMLQVCRYLGVEPACVLAVGDSEIDVAFARAAGTAICAVGWGRDGKAALAEYAPDHLIETPFELLSLVGCASG